MENYQDIMLLLHTRQMLLQDVKLHPYGSIEIRNKKNIYIHYRKNGKHKSKYMGEYSERLYNEILCNKMYVSGIKKSIREINKKLKKLNYEEKELPLNIQYNIDFAKRNLVYTIYNQAILEGITTTFLDTESIIENGKVNNMNAEDVLKIINLKHAWEFILNQNVILAKSNYYLLCEINKFILQEFYYTAGRIRSVPVGIGGTKWKPDIPIESDIKDDINLILISESDDVDIAINLLLYIMKKQIFIDGNKRTSILFTNHYLISHCRGIIVIPAENTSDFKKLLLEYYETNEDEKIKQFLKEKCYRNIGDLNESIF